MFRKIVIAAAAAAALGAAALVPTTASAHWHGGWHGGWYGGWHRPYWGPRFAYAPVYPAYNPCLRRRWVPTPWGPRLRVVNVCY